MRGYALHDIAELVGGTLHGDPRQQVTGVSIDSRTLVPARTVLFFAIRGPRHDGHQYIEDLHRAGVINFVVQDLPGDQELVSSANWIRVGDSTAALQKFAAAHRSASDIPVMAITGSNGKTVVKEWLFELLSRDRNICRSPKSFNSQVGVPLSLLLLERDHEMGLFEAGISHPGEMHALEQMIRPDTGIITNIGEAHQEHFDSYRQKVREKILLFKNCRTIIYCSDHQLIDEELRTAYPDKELFDWSENRGSRVFLKESRIERGSRLLKVQHEGRDFDLRIPFIDRASAENAMHAVACLLCLGYDGGYVGTGLQQLSQVGMRLELVNGINRCILINDSYNSDFHSLSLALDFLNQQKQYDQKRLILSDIQQSGRRDEDLYAGVAKLIREKDIRQFTGVGRMIWQNRHLFPGQSGFYRSTDEFIAELDPDRYQNEAILIKGSRSFAFERIVHALEQKVHSTVMEIDLAALVHNLNVYRSLIDARTAVMVMVKALSYGSGSWEIASALQYQKVDYLCVAFVDEGVSLRRAGIHLPVLVLNPGISGFSQMIDHRLEPELYNFSSLEAMAGAVKSSIHPEYPVHIKLETGMNRLGFAEGELDELMTFLENNKQLKIRSVFSHLAAADDPRHDDFTEEQIDRFTGMSERLMASCGYPFLRHLLNTGGIERFPRAQYDMVRLGIGLFGISATRKEHLLPVNTLKTIISQVREVEKGASVGYSRNFVATSRMRVGVIPVGYADGLSRNLGNGRWQVMAGRHPAPIIGNICMDMCMIDISGTNAREGDEVVIFGSGLPVEDMAARAGTIPYEVLSRISERVKRMYIQ